MACTGVDGRHATDGLRVCTWVLALEVACPQGKAPGACADQSEDSRWSAKLAPGSAHAPLTPFPLAQVYLGKWRRHGLVALKLLKVADEQHERAFVCEAELLRALRHPNIVSYLGACLEPGQARAAGL